MALTYTNPVFPRIMADPFVLKHEGHYYAFGTGPAGPNGERFPLLHSTNLVDWEQLGWALMPPGGDEFWAPEVAFSDGVFYLYYSAHGIEGRDHHLCVAVSETPTGPYRDTGQILVPDQPFSIDPHPFRAPDGTWYLFYAQDFLTLDGDHRVGTGVVVDQLLDMQTLAGRPQVVVRPHADWHLFLSQREMYGNVYDWHTVEGPALRLHDGLYYCFYSGGAWERENYGISYVVAEHPLGPYRRPDGEPKALLMHTLPGRVIGPGHNSFTHSPDGSEEWIVYHAWDPAMTGRYMCIDRFHWQADKPVVLGPTTDLRPAPSNSTV
jgi:GH43 family beta-xylosidase